MKNALAFTVVASIAVASGAVATASADLIMLMADLAGANERPNPVNSPGTGSAMLMIDTVTGNWDLTGNYQGLLSAAVAAHIHGFADVNNNAPVLVGLNFTQATGGTLTGNGVFTMSQVTSFTQGLGYVNVHTSGFPGGEIRGQLMMVPGPSSAMMLGLGGLACARRRR